MAENSSVSWLFRLVDGVSGPSSGILKSIDNVTKRFEALEKKDPSSGMRRSLRLFRLAAEEADGPLKSLIGTVTGFGLAAATSAIALVALGTKSALNAAAFRRDTIRGLSAITGIGDEADRVFASASRMSQRTIFDDKDFMSFLRSLRGAGLTETRANDVLAAISDVASFNPDRKNEVGKGLTDLFERMKNSNVFDMSTIESVASLSGGVISQADLVKKIASLKKWSVTTDAEFQAAKNAISQGIIKNTEGTNILLDMVKNKLNAGKGLGFASRDFTESSLEGTFSRIKKQVSSIFASIDIKPFADALKSISDLLDENTQTGQSLRAIFNGIFADISGGLKNAIDPGSLMSAFVAIKAAITVFWGATKGFFDGLMGTLKDLFEPLMTIARLTDSTGKKTSFVGESMKAIGKVVAGVLAIITYAAIGIGAAIYGLIAIFEGLWWVIKKFFGVVYDVVNYLLDIPSKIENGITDGILATLNFFEKIYDKFTEAGKNVINGFVKGIKDRWEAIKNTVKDVANGVVDTVKDTLGIKSPSRVMIGLGKFTMEGFTQGVNDNAEAAQSAIKQAISINSTPSYPSPQQAPTRANASPQISVTINVTTQGTDAQAAEETAFKFEIALREALSRALESAA